MLTQAYGKQHATTGAAGGSSSLDRVEELFGPGGKLAAALPGFEPREEQLDLARAVAGALDQEEHLLAEAGTGTGKSLAYLLPALASGKRVVVATATKALQEQLLTKDVPSAVAALGRSVDCALLKGRENYLCRRLLTASVCSEAAGALFRKPRTRRSTSSCGTGSTRPSRAIVPSCRSSRAERCGPRSPWAATGVSAGAATRGRSASRRRHATGRPPRSS